MKLNSSIRPWLAAALWAVAGASQATLVTYGGNSAFLAAVTSPGVDSFDDLSTQDSTASPMSRMAGSYGYTATASTQGFFGAGTPAADVWLSTDQFSDTITFDGFAAGVSAIGGLFFGSDLFGQLSPGQSILLEATDGDGSLSHILMNTGEQSFFGFVSDGPLLSFKVSAIQTDLATVWPAVNNLTLASAGGGTPTVPEPASLALAALGLTLGVGLRRKPVRQA